MKMKKKQSVLYLKDLLFFTVITSNKTNREIHNVDRKQNLLS